MSHADVWVVGVEEGDGSLIFEDRKYGHLYNSGETPEDFGWGFLFPNEMDLVIAAIYPWGEA